MLYSLTEKETMFLTFRNKRKEPLGVGTYLTCKTSLSTALAKPDAMHEVMRDVIDHVTNLQTEAVKWYQILLNYLQ